MIGADIRSFPGWVVRRIAKIASSDGVSYCLIHAAA
jgi:hypothetical protein